MGFTTLDYLIVIAYLIGMATLGILSGGKQTSTRDYFLGNKSIPWWAVCFAIVATETSALTFISIPGIAYATNLNFFQLTIGYLIGRIVISFLFLPAYYRGELSTAYGFLNQRFGGKTRNFSAAIFMGTRTLADGVRLYATAIPLAILFKGYTMLTNFSNREIYILAISIMAGVTLAYTFIGGMRAVIWTDVIQMFIYLGGAVAGAIVLLNKFPDGWTSVVREVGPQGKLSVISLGFDKPVREFFTTPYTLIASVIGGGFLSMASHGTDQLIVQRLLATDSLRSSQKALITSGVIVMAQFLLFLIIGSMLLAFYHGALISPDEVFPKFIIEQMPSGISGLIIAGLLAAAMSTLSGSINSLASSTMLDLYKPYFGKENSPEQDLRISRILSLFWGGLLTASAIYFMNTSKAVVELGLTIASFTYGGLLGTFLLGVLFQKPKQLSAITGFIAGIVAMTLIITLTKIAWTWYTVIGASVTVAIGNLFALFQKE